MVSKEELGQKIKNSKREFEQRIEIKKAELEQKFDESKKGFEQKIEDSKKEINFQMELTKLQVEKKLADTKNEINQKLIETPLNDYHNLAAYANQMRLPFFKSLVPYLYQVSHNFFFIQMKQVLHISKIPVIYVDTPLDYKIPFIPEKVEIYMDFIPFFLRPILMLSLRMDKKQSAQLDDDFMKILTAMYKNAAEIYNFCMTTTQRPKYYKGKFKTIHAFDPHLLCVPSLHVAISTVTYAYYRSLRGKNILPEQELEERIAEIRSYAIQIIESVLFVKQHSVNCVPAAIYMVTATTPDNFFSVEDAYELIDSIFLHCPETEMPADLREEIITYFKNFYNRCYNEYSNSTDKDWQEPLKNWLTEFAVETNQPAKKSKKKKN